MRRRDCLVSLGLALPTVAAGAAEPLMAKAPTPPGSPAVIPHSTMWRMTSDDGRRYYRVMMALPAEPPPPGGWPVIYVLDGNAFFATMVEAVRLEAFMAGYQPAVVVGVGYDIDGPIDVTSRNYDYTPPTQAPPEYDDRNPTRLAGGADVFIDFLRRRLIPAVSARVAVDPVQSCLFGHSYGGLFGVYCFLKDNALFGAVAATSPSLWYKHDHVLRLADTVLASKQLGGRLLLMVGESEQHPDADEIALMGAQRAAMLEKLGQVDHAVGLARLLATHGIDASPHVFAGETHVSVAPGAISRAVRFFLRRTKPEGPR